MEGGQAVERSVGLGSHGGNAFVRGSAYRRNHQRLAVRGETGGRHGGGDWSGMAVVSQDAKSATAGLIGAVIGTLVAPASAAPGRQSCARARVRGRTARGCNG